MNRLRTQGRRDVTKVGVYLSKKNDIYRSFKQKVEDSKLYT